MSASTITTNRLATLAQLAETSPTALGRTALMKLCYFMQTLQGIPLGYEFTLYSYGPFDSEVLSDLHTAESLSILQSSVSHFSGGYSYQIEASDNADQAIQHGKDFITQHKTKINWIVSKFASRSASELELLSTIVFVDRQDKVVSKSDLVKLVKAIKPQFSETEILKKVDWLRKEELLNQV